MIPQVNNPTAVVRKLILVPVMNDVPAPAVIMAPDGSMKVIELMIRFKMKGGRRLIVTPENRRAAEVLNNLFESL